MIEEEQYIIFKILAGIILFIGPIIFAIIPFVLTRIKNKFINEKVIMSLLDILNGFAGGALLATGFIHLLRKIKKKKSTQKKNLNS